jgi:hypothetical protein
VIPYGLSAVMVLRPKIYNQHDSKTKNGKVIISNVKKQRIGIVAQEAQKIVPEAVSVGNDTVLWSVDYSALVPVLIRAIQEQQAQIDSLSVRITRMGGQL